MLTALLRATFIALLIGVSTALVPVTYAAAPNEARAGGFWEDVDFDDARHVVGSVVALVRTFEADEDSPCLPLIGAVPKARPRLPRSAALSEHHARSPPR